MAIVSIVMLYVARRAGEANNMCNILILTAGTLFCYMNVVHCLVYAGRIIIKN